MRRGWIAFGCLVALGAAAAFAADEADKATTGPSLEYRPPRPILPEPKGPTPAPPVTVFRESYGRFGIGAGSFNGPVDVAIGGQGSIYVLDGGNSRVQMFTERNEFVLEWGGYGTDERRGQFKRPTTIAVVPGLKVDCSNRDFREYECEVVLVLDTGNNRIQWFKVPLTGDPRKLPNLPVGHEDSLFRTYVAPPVRVPTFNGTAVGPEELLKPGDYGDLGEYGIADGRFSRPLDIAFEEPTLRGVATWVLDAGNDRIQRFFLSSQEDGSGRTTIGVEYVEQINRLSGDRGNLKDLFSIAWSRERSFHYLYLLGRGCSLQKFKLSSAVEPASSSSIPSTGNTLGAAQPVLDATWPAVAPESGLCVPARVRYDERRESVYVLDAGNSLLSIFYRNGNFISAIRGADRLFDEPRGFSFRPESGEFAVADTDNNLVQKFTLR